MGSDMLGVQMFPGYDDFNPRSPDGERLQSSLIAGLRDEISIHAPRMGSDELHNAIRLEYFGFQSTLPGWGATTSPRRRRRRTMHFNPRSPDGERPGGFSGMDFP